MEYCNTYDPQKTQGVSFVCGNPAVVKIPNAIKYPVDNKGTMVTTDRFLCLKHWIEKHQKK